MESGAITQYVDVAQLVLYLFWIFFFGLVIYLTIESKREDFLLNLMVLVNGRVKRQLVCCLCQQKRFLELSFTVILRHPMHGMMQPFASWISYKPVSWSAFGTLRIQSNADDIGPGSFSQRIDHPDLTAEGDFKIVPMRIEKSFKIFHLTRTPRLEVFGLEGKWRNMCRRVGRQIGTYYPLYRNQNSIW